VLREGVEVVLFLYGAAADGGSNLGLFVGGVAGLMLGTLVCLLTYLGLLSIPVGTWSAPPACCWHSLPPGWPRRRPRFSSRPMP
jgi:hypothetical protein